MVEDVTDIVLNLKKILFKLPNREPRVLFLNIVKEGTVTAGDIKLDAGVEVLNPEQVIAILDKKQRFEAELEVKVGRGYCSAEYNKHAEQSIGVIAIDSLFSPVRKVKYSVENTRVGQRTDYDKLILEIWTDGRLTPDEALLQASAILRHHLDLFVDFDKETIEFEESQPQVSHGKQQAQEAPQHERQRDRAVGPRRELPQQREHHHGRPAGHEDRGRDAQVPQLRQEVA